MEHHYALSYIKSRWGLIKDLSVVDSENREIECLNFQCKAIDLFNIEYIAGKLFSNVKSYFSNILTSF